ncbi:MAG: class I SAM-dependent methyltransferase [bacterium]|nr:class I SAM-dependent methyltransferase [bacterium]
MVKPDSKFFEALEQFADQDPFQVSLKAGKYPDLDIPFIVQQLEARKKAKTKLPEWYSNGEVLFPVSLSMEQCSSEITGRYKTENFTGEHLVDLTGGAGVDSYYFSKVFERVDYVERNQDLVDLAAYNFGVLGVNNINCHAQDSIDYLKNLDKKPSHVFIDPARRDGNNKKVHSFLDCEPNVLELLPDLISWGTKVMIKASPMLDITLGVSQLKHVSRLHIVSVKNDCKELLFELDKSSSNNTEVRTVNYRSGQTEEFSFRLNESQEANAVIGSIDKYLFEPNASTMKSGAFNLISKEFEVTKLNVNTHLYSSSDLTAGFPGRRFEVLWSGSPSKKELKKWLKSDKVSVATRNYPMTVDQVRKKFQLKDGESNYLFFYRNEKNKLEVAICEKVI